ncbi:tryptophan--tRNA ligase [Candidatus Heimdallarchaeota archaeon]|nr:MAG: tryptophan--tRNA ligase [Candidatus Heimdallarchaeota archaeon]
MIIFLLRGVKMNQNTESHDIEKREDYEEVLKEFGISKIESILPRIGIDHLFFRRGVVFAHRDFDEILNRIEKNKSFAIISGRGPSNDLHFGHLILFDLIRYLQNKYNCKYFLPFSDDEKYVFRKVETLEGTYNLAIQNAIDIFAIGFKPDDVHAYISSITPRIHYLALNFSINQTYNAVKAALGLTGEENVGTSYYTFIQAAHILHPTIDQDLPVVVPIGLDQDVYMRLTRDIARKRKITLPSSLYIKYLKGLTGGPMSSSAEETCVFLRDEPEVIKKKIMKALTGGRDTIKEQRELGANPEVCTIFDWFTKYFVEDDEELEEIERGCRSGGLICGLDCKPKLIEMIIKYQEGYKKRKKEVIKNIEKYFDHEIDLSGIGSD